MQQPTRYYITKSGEEWTVRSVRVARSASEPIEAPETDSRNPADRSPVERERRDHRFSVKDLLPGAIKKRVPEL